MHTHCVTHTHTLSLSHSLCVCLSRTHTHTLTRSLSLSVSHTHTHSLSLCANCRDNVIRLSVALKNNPKASLTHLDLSHNTLEDRGICQSCLLVTHLPPSLPLSPPSLPPSLPLPAAVESLGLALEALTHGLKDLRLANCKMTPRGIIHVHVHCISRTSLVHAMNNIHMYCI